MKIRIYIVFNLLICFSVPFFAQIRDTSILLTPATNAPSGLGFEQFKLKLDSLQSQDSLTLLLSDSLKKPEQNYVISKDAIDTEVTYDARDSSWIDLVNQKIHLYGEAVVNYQALTLKANYMVIDFANNLIEGFAKKDSLDTSKEKPTFKDQNNTFTYNHIKYNFKSKKGLVEHAITKQGEFNLVGSTTKFVGGSVDSLGQKADDEVYNKNAIVTTCDHDPPHFGIRVGKLKFVPNKLAVMSVAQVEIAKIPTPIFLPFGFFPLTSGRSSGLIFPSSYEYNEQLGIGFREIGYYYPINDYLDMRFTGDIYTRGTYRLKVNATYKKLYAYDGTINLEYGKIIGEDARDGRKLSEQAFSINIRHTQSNKAHPYIRFGGSINVQTNRYDQRTYNTAELALKSTYSSNFSFSHDMPGTPFRFNAEFRHSQNTQTRIVDITLPNMSLRMNTIFPFKRKNASDEKWYEKISLVYSSEFRNFVKTTDTTLFTSQTWQDFQTGMQHKASMNTNVRVLKYFNLAPSISYDETWLLKKYQLTFDPSSVRLDTLTRQPLTFDTLGYQPAKESFRREFGTFRNVNIGVSLNTQLFGYIRSSKGFFRGVRHHIKPFVSFNYTPENRARYEAVVDTDARPRFNRQRTYSIFTNSPFGTLQGGQKQMSMTYGFTSIFEGKYYSKKDAKEKTFRIFDNIGLNGSYNFAADSFRWSDLRISGVTTLVKDLTNITIAANYSPYVYDQNNRITKETLWDKQKKLLELRNFGVQMFTSVTFGRIFDLISGKKTTPSPNPNNDPTNANQSGAIPNADQPPNVGSTTEESKEISLADWFSNFNISHTFSYEVRKLANRDTSFIGTHAISLSGSIPLTKKWNLGIGNIAYDFQTKSFPYPDLSFRRDLHCWEMNFSWRPSDGVYSFYIGVKSTAMNFLSYDYGQRNANLLLSGQR